MQSLKDPGCRDGGGGGGGGEHYIYHRIITGM